MIGNIRSYADIGTDAYGDMSPREEELVGEVARLEDETTRLTVALDALWWMLHHDDQTPKRLDALTDIDLDEMRAIILADAGLLARPLPARDEIAEELSGWPIGHGYYTNSVASGEAQDMADAVLALLKGQDA